MLLVTSRNAFLLCVARYVGALQVPLMFWVYAARAVHIDKNYNTIVAHV